MSLTIEAERAPLRVEADGTVRIGQSRVTLDTIIYGYLQGESAEEIADGFPTVTLGQVYATISYFLAHREEVEEYLRLREAEAAALRAEIERAQGGRSNLREKLMARMRNRAKQP